MVHEFYIDMDNPMISESSSKTADGDETTATTTTATEDTVVNHTATREIATVSSTTDPIGNETFTCIITDMTDPSNSCKRHVINLSSKYTLEDLIQEAGAHYAYDPFTFCLMWKCPTGDMINVSEIQANNLNLAHLGLKGSGKNLFEIHEKEEGPPKKLKSTTTAEESNPDEMPSLEETLHPTSSSGITPRRNALYCPWETVSTSSPQTAGCSSQIEFGPANMPSSTLCGSFGPGPFGVSSRDDDSNEYVGLINQAMTCYLNSLIQTLYMTPEFRNGIYRWNYQGVINDEEEARKSIPYQLQRLFLNLQTSKKKSIHTQDLTKSFGWNNDDAFQQHDVQELCRVMFDALEKRFKGTRQENLINELYQGKVKDYVKCLECHTESARVDVFLDIPLCIRPFGSDKTYESVEAALDAFVQPEILDENNKYFCAKCDKMCKAHKGLKFESFPYILSLQLKRFDFDYKTMSRIKLSNTVSFPEVLNVEKYLKEPSNNENEDESTNKELQVDEIIEEEEKAPRDSGLDYELFSIMIHSGSATGGHYYAYIKSFETNQWYNFNDERVSRVDKDDIIKTYGHSHSTYSSTTAYMLFYRLRSDKRNEKVMHVDNFDEHLRKLLDRERNQQIEADRLKEYMENVCKIKCIAPAVKSLNGSNNGSMVSAETDDAKISSTTNGGRDSREQSPALLDALKKKVEKTVEIHKDLTLEMAKEQIIKEFELGDYLKESKKKARILKYDTHNELIEQSYANESTSVFEALGFTKYAYNVSWLLELVDEQEEFVEYNSNDCSVKVCHVDMQTFETSELFTVRLPSECTVYELRERIAQKLNVGQSNRLRMALEKLHTLYNYVYLNSNMMDTLRQMNFTRVNKVFVDWTETSDDESSTTPFETSKFYYTLDTIINMLNMVVYLPNEEQCNLFVKKTQRHKAYIENKLKQQSPKTSVNVAVSSTTAVNTANDENTIDSYENVPSVLSQACDSPTLSSLAAKSDIVMTTTTNNSDVKDLLNEGFYSPISTTSTATTTNATTSRNIDINFEKKAISVDEEDSASKMSFQETSAIFAAATAQQPQQQQKSTDANFSLIEDHFKIGNKPSSGSSTTTTTTVTSNNNGGTNDNKLVDLNLNDMETSLDEGIGSSGSLSTNNTNTTNSSNQQQHNQNKNSPSQSVEMMMMNSAPPIKLSPIVNNEESMSLSSPQQPQQQQNTPTNTKTSISDEWYYKGGGSHTMGGLDLDDVKNNYEQERVGNNDDEDETNLGDVADRCFDDVADLDVNIDDNEVYNIESDSETATNGVVGGQREKPLSLNERADRYTANSEIPTSGVPGGFFEPYWDDPSNSHQPNFHHNESKVAHKNTADLFLNDDDALPKYSEIANTSSINKQKFISTSSQQVSDGSGDNRGNNNFFDYFNKLNDVRYIKSTLNVNDELSTRTLEIKMDKRIDLSEFKSHVDEYLKISVDNFRVFRMCPNDLECELTSSENQFLYLANNSKFLIKLGPPLKYGEYVLAVFKMNKAKGNFVYLCEFMCFHGLSVLDHKEMLVDDLKDELDLQIPIEKMRLRKKISKRPGAILLDHEVFGTDIFVNAMTELCIEILDEPEKKSSKLQTSIYLRHWKPDEYELGELKEAIIEGNAFDNLLTYISEISKIPLDDIEVLKCKRDYPFNSPILDLHRDQAWKDNYFLQMEKLEDGACFYYRNKTLKLGTISEEKKKEMEKEDNLNFRTNSYSIMPTKKEIGIKII